MANKIRLVIASFVCVEPTLLTLGAGSFISQFTFTSPAGRVLRAIAGAILVGFGMWQVRGQSLNFAWLNKSLQPLWTQQARLRRSVVRSMKTNTRSVKRLGGSVLIIVGIWLVVLAVWSDSFARILFI